MNYDRIITKGTGSSSFFKNSPDKSLEKQRAVHKADKIAVTKKIDKLIDYIDHYKPEIQPSDEEPSISHYSSYVNLDNDSKSGILSFLDVKSASKLAVTCKNENKNISKSRLFWTIHLLSLGIPKEALEALSDSIENFQHLYRTLLRIHRVMQKKDFIRYVNTRTKILVLSGEDNAVEKILLDEDLRNQIHGPNGETLIHFLALSGVPAQLQKGVDIGLDIHATDNNGTGVIHYCAWSGVPAQLQKGVDSGLDIHATINNGAGVIHFCQNQEMRNKAQSIIEALHDSSEQDNDTTTTLAPSF